MEEIILLQHNTIATLFIEKLQPLFIKRITEHHEAMSKIDTLQKKLIGKNFTKEEEHLAIKALNAYKTDLEIIVSDYFSLIESNKDGFCDTYYAALETYLETVEHTVKRPQDKERFYALNSDSLLIKYVKPVKRTLFHLSKIPVKTANIFTKEKKEIRFWQQEIPLKNVTEYYFKSDLISNLTVVFDAIYTEISEITNKYWSIDAAIDDKIKYFIADDGPLTFSDVLLTDVNEIPSLATRIEKHSESLNQIFEATFLKYTKALYTADTIELSAKFFSTQKNVNFQKSVLEKSSKNEILWQNTYSVLKSDWDLDIEIFKIIFKVMFKYKELEVLINTRTNLIKHELKSIQKYIVNLKANISGAKTNLELENFISKELKFLKTNFRNNIEGVTLLVSNQELPLLIDQFEENVLNIIKSFSTKRAISSNNNYTTKTHASTINYISPYELVTYQSWPGFEKKINIAKLELNVKVTTFIEDINGLSQVCEFNLESALSLFENSTIENLPQKVALEGLERSEEKIEELKSTVSNINKINGGLLLPSIAIFNKSILALTATENIVQIRLSIARTKSIEKSKLLKKRILSTVKNFVPIALLFVKTNYTNALVAVKNWLLRSGLYKEPTAVHSDLYSFLKQSEKALDELPFVYQRLFRSETLHNEALFIGRVEVLETLEKAFSVFNENQYAATIIIGERGSGKTSLIHYFLNKNNQFTNTFIFSPTKNISEPDDLISFLNSSFSKDFNNIQEWVTYFNSGKKRTIILENLQYLYFRKVGGFNALHQFSMLVSATKQSVFWVVTCSKYTFQYLDKSIQLSELFAFTIEMNAIDKETLKEALLKRHKISGYNLYFNNPPDAYLSKKFLKSSEVVQQEILKEEFFTDINKIAQSNFKIAFMYWIRSTVTVSGSTVYLSSLKSIDTSFLNKIPPVKLMLLNSILLHERLTMDEIVALSSLGTQHTQNIVHALYEKGLLTIDDVGYYTINIFLYRQITSLLKSKNMIH